MVWKNTIATDHTEGEPPSRGSTILVNIGSIRNSSAALRKMAAMNVPSSAACDCAARLLLSTAGRSSMARVLVLSFPLRDLGGLGLRGPGPFAHPLPEIPEMLMQLLEREAEREEVLQRVTRQHAHQAFAANCGNLGGVALEGRIGGIDRRRRDARDEG